MPNEREVHLLMDGRLISNLQIEPALKCGAENVIALDMNDFREPPVPGPEVDKLIKAQQGGAAEQGQILK